MRQEGVRGVGVKSCGVVLGRKSYVFAGGKKFERKGGAGRRVFLALLDAFGVTPV